MAQEERPGGAGVLRAVPGRAGGAGGWSGHHVLRGPAGRLSSTEKAAMLGCFGLKIPGGDRESLKGNVKKKKKWEWGRRTRAVVQELLRKNKIKKKKKEKKIESLKWF